MDRDEIARQGKQMAADLRDTVSQKVSENEDTIKGTLGKAARWVDEKTGGKYSDHIGKAESKVGDGIGWVASQGPTTPESGAPSAPGASAADPAPGAPTTGTNAPGSTPPGPIVADSPGTGADTPPTAPGSRPPGPIAPDEGEMPRPPQV